MRAREIINELIDYSSYKDDAYKLVYSDIVKELRTLPKDLDEQEFNNIDLGPDTDNNKIKEILRKYISISLKYNIESSLTTLGRNILGLTKMPPRTSVAKLLQVELRDIGQDLGIANPVNSKVLLNEKVFYSPMVERILNKLIELLWESWEDTTLFNNLKRMLSILVREKYSLNDFMHQFQGLSLITSMVSTYIHELVHVKQHYFQQLNQLPGGGYRQNTEYRSYLAKRDVFLKSFAKNAANEYVDPILMSRLHASSPQEIGAFVNNIAIEVIDSLYMETYSKDELIHYYKQSSKDISDLSKLIVSSVNNHLKSRDVFPNTKTEKRIYQRYYKMVSVIVNNYVDYLIKKKQEAQPVTEATRFVKTTDITKMKEMFRDGKSFLEIGKEMGFKYDTVRKYLETVPDFEILKSQNKINRERILATRINPNLLQNDEKLVKNLRKLYKAGNSEDTITKQLNISRWAVRNILQQQPDFVKLKAAHDKKLISMGDRAKLRKPNKIGTFINWDNVTQKIIDRYRSGETYQTIANKLNISIDRVFNKLKSLENFAELEAEHNKNMSHMRRFPIDKEPEVIQMFRDGYTFKEIMGHFGLKSDMSLRRIINNHSEYSSLKAEHDKKMYDRYFSKNT
jgi:DNA-binding CsgD family transcriptional regulator